MNQKHIRALSLLCSLLLLLGLVFSFFFYSYAADGEYEFPMYYMGQRLSAKGYWLRGNVYVTADVMKRYGDCSQLTFNTASKHVEYDPADWNLEMADPETTAFVQEWAGKMYHPMKTVDGKQVISLNTFESVTKLSAYFDEANKRIILQPYAAGSAIVFAVTEDTVCVPSFDSYSTESFVIRKGTQVYQIGETDNYYKIQTTGGVVGYIMKSVASDQEKDLSGLDFYAPQKAKNIDPDVPFSLSWVNVSANASTIVCPDPKPGLDILSPTWLRLEVEKGGEINNSTDPGFVRLAHQNGYQVWGMISNYFTATGSTNFTTKLFNDSDIQNKAIAQYLFYACFYDWDGINVDFEDLKDEHRNGFTSFMTNLRKWTERQGLVLSVDTMVPESWAVEYDYKALSEVTDYVIVMTYDEYYSTSEKAGSTASLPWVEKYIKTALTMVPSEKLVMGVPLYTRWWTVYKATNKRVTNPSATMPRVQEVIQEKNLTPKWLTKEKQYYLEWPDSTYSDRVNKIWVEDSRSIANRLNLVDKYGLAGAASWQYSQAGEDIWNVYYRMLKEGEPLSTFDVDLY